VVLAAVGVAIALAGCTAASVAPSGSPAPSSTAVADSPLRTVFPNPFDSTSAEKETVRIADAIDALIPKASVVYVDNHAQLVAATDKAGSYYGVLRTLTLSPSLDPLATAASIVTDLKAAGWMQLSTKDTGGVHVVTLSSGSLASESWFVVVSGDPSTPGQSVVAVQLASPDIP
jgi:hypothetical protein